MNSFLVSLRPWGCSLVLPLSEEDAMLSPLYLLLFVSNFCFKIPIVQRLREEVWQDDDEVDVELKIEKLDPIGICVD